MTNPIFTPVRLPGDPSPRGEKKKPSKDEEKTAAVFHCANQHPATAGREDRHRSAVQAKLQIQTWDPKQVDPSPHPSRDGSKKDPSPRPTSKLSERQQEAIERHLRRLGRPKATESSYSHQPEPAQSKIKHQRSPSAEGRTLGLVGLPPIEEGDEPEAPSRLRSNSLKPRKLGAFLRERTLLKAEQAEISYPEAHKLFTEIILDFKRKQNEELFPGHREWRRAFATSREEKDNPEFTTSWEIPIHPQVEVKNGTIASAFNFSCFPAKSPLFYYEHENGIKGVALFEGEEGQQSQILKILDRLVSLKGLEETAEEVFVCAILKTLQKIVQDLNWGSFAGILFSEEFVYILGRAYVINRSSEITFSEGAVVRLETKALPDTRVAFSTQRLSYGIEENRQNEKELLSLKQLARGLREEGYTDPEDIVKKLASIYALNAPRILCVAIVQPLESPEERAQKELKKEFPVAAFPRIWKATTQVLSPIVSLCEEPLSPSISLRDESPDNSVSRPKEPLDDDEKEFSEDETSTSWVYNPESTEQSIRHEEGKSFQIENVSPDIFLASYPSSQPNNHTIFKLRLVINSEPAYLVGLVECESIDLEKVGKEIAKIFSQDNKNSIDKREALHKIIQALMKEAKEVFPPSAFCLIFKNCVYSTNLSEEGKEAPSIYFAKQTKTEVTLGKGAITKGGNPAKRFSGGSLAIFGMPLQKGINMVQGVLMLSSNWIHIGNGAQISGATIQILGVFDSAVKLGRVAAHPDSEKLNLAFAVFGIKP